MRTILTICTFIIFASCNNKKRSEYIIQLRYLDDNSIITKDLRNDFVALDFLNFFSNDSLKIKVNSAKFLETTITTSEITGSALTLKVGSLRNVKQISIQLNSGEWAIIKCDKNNQLFTIQLINDTLKIKSVSLFPPNL
jgi:hypothetical protein